MTFVISHLLAQDGKLILKNLEDFQVQMAGFVLKEERSVPIHAIGAGGKKELKRVYNYQQDRHNMYAYAWIVNSETRKMVWRMTIENTERMGDLRLSREFNSTVHLPKGTYEVYFTAIRPGYYLWDGGFFSFNKLLKYIFTEDNEWEDSARDWIVEINQVDEIYSRGDVKKILRSIRKNAIISLTDTDDDHTAKKGFSLIKPLEVKIYGLGEGYKGKMFDYGWIIDARSRETIWKMEENESEYAGGAVKNRLFQDEIKLPAGDYIVYFRTDANHSSNDWNANPPYDPYFWGITLRASDESFDPAMVKEYEEKEVKPVVSITKVGNDAYLEKMFELKEKASLRIYAIGEGMVGEMFDFGWITNAETGETVWKMTYDKTKHAGGAGKNRLVDEIVELQPGRYKVHYRSDDSHCYDNWNRRRPQHEEKWGITIYPVSESARTARIIHKRTDEDLQVLARLTRVGDDEHVRKRFTLKKKTRIRIYCIGEGDRDEMYDYGWIENVKTGRRVWKMRFSKTKHAGGAKKNRLADTIITLKPGTYEVHFKSDDTHSYYEWNDDPPRQPKKWGITVYKLHD
ncbi:MAG TPA: hypothetical protein EYP36_07790 [Calditrichaeota bacterium]|nr:hypothetical protein [Calditrichota bacterium]